MTPILPDLVLSARQLFGLDTDLQVPAFSAADEHVQRIVTEALVHAERLSGSGAGPTGTRRAS